jgi:tetratricopeptide (TPR) repeat protein
MIRALVIALLASILTVHANPASDAHLRAGIEKFTAAYRAWDADGFAEAAGEFRMATAADPHSARAYYWLGTARFHRMLQLRNQQPPQTDAANDAMEHAIEALETALTLAPDYSECHALLGTLFGMKIHGGLLRAIRYGPSVQNHQKQALRSGGNNPRVRYLLGTGLFHTAKDADGYREALDALLMAEKLFIAESGQAPEPFAPRWGLSTCRTFIGRTLVKLGDKDRAADYFRKALAEHPNDHIARAELAKISPP